MSYSDSQLPSLQTQSPFHSYNAPMPLQTPYQLDNDVIGVWPHFPINSNGQYDPHSQWEQHQPPQKRPRNSEDDQLKNSRMLLPNNLQVNKGTNIFFKTKICAKFKAGSCRNGENCNFAHGEQDKRQPPPNWQELVGFSMRGEEDKPVGNWEDDERIIHRLKLCKKFYNGEVCPYGDRCNFLHEDPAKFRDDVGRFRESAAISIGTTEQPMGQASRGFNVTEVNRCVINNAANTKTVYWKTKLCTKWETTGQCPFGENCHFAHGIAELQAPNGRPEGEAGNVNTILTKPQQFILANNASPTKTMNIPSLIEGQGNKCLLKWKGSKKINRIYGDWLDDLPLGHKSTNEVES